MLHTARTVITFYYDITVPGKHKKLRSIYVNLQAVTLPLKHNYIDVQDYIAGFGHMLRSM